MFFRMHRILLVEDNAETQRLILSTLQPNQVVAASSVAEAKEALSKAQFDLILLDVSLPDGDGFALGSEIRRDENLKHLALFFLTCHSGISDKVAGFSVGADDYITKPFDPLELKVRVESRLRKFREISDQSSVFKKGSLKFELPVQRVRISGGVTEASLDLTSLEFRLLLHLARNEDQLFSRDELLDKIWGDDLHVTGRTVDSHVSKIRRKLNGSGYTLKSVYGSGYRFALDADA